MNKLRYTMLKTNQNNKVMAVETITEQNTADTHTGF